MFNDNRFHQQWWWEAIDENTTLFEIIDNNNTLFLSWFENDTEKKYEINERIIKESFKMSILSNLQWFYDSPIHNSNSFILFAGIPIEKLCIKNSIIYSTNNPIFWKLLFEAFIEYLEVLKKDEQDIQSYIEYFQLIFSPTNLSLYPKDENFIYDEEWDVIQINDWTIWTDEFNEQNLFNYLYIEDTINILHKLSHNLETGNNFLWQLMREFILKINNDSEEKTKDLLRHYLQKGKEELMYFMISLMGYNNIIWWLDTSKIELFEKIFSEIDTAMSQYFKELTHIQINNDDQNLIKYSNKFNTEKESIWYQVWTKDPTLLTFKVSKDNTVFTSTSWKYAWYWEYTEEPFNGEQYITYCLAVFINNLKQWHSLDSLFNFLDAELHFAIKKESHKNIFEYIENIIWKKWAFFIQKKFEWKTSHEDFQNFMQELSQIEQISYQPTNIVPKRSISEIMESLDIYWNLNKEYFEKILEIFHTTDLINIVSYDLQIDITNLTLQTQVHLLRFLWEQTTEKFKEFKQTLLNIPEENQKYNFLTTFLACSQDLSMWDKIIELANRDWTEEIFQTYAELVELQNELNLQNLWESTILNIVLKKGKWLIEEAYANNRETWKNSQIQTKYSESLVRSALSVKNIIKWQESWSVVNIDEFNEANLGFKLNIFNWWNIITWNSLIDMVSQENYNNQSNMSKEDFVKISDWIKISLEDKNDPDLPNLILNALIKDLHNTNANFIFLRNKKNELMWICKIIKNNDWSFYYWSHYLHRDIMSDFSIWMMMQKILENNVSHWKELNATIKLNNIDWVIRHIEYWGWIWEYLHTISKSDFLHFKTSINTKYKSKNKVYSMMNDFNILEWITSLNYENWLNPDEIDSVLKKWFVLTRVLENEQIIIFERQKNNLQK